MQYSELIKYFKDRLTELFHKDSLDSYRVRHHNTLSILIELRYLIYGWQNKSIKRAETVQFCINDVKSIIEEDSVFDFSICSKKKFQEILSQFYNELNDASSKKDRQSSLRGTNLIYLLNKYISANRNSYLTSLWNKVEEIIFNPGNFNDDDFVKIVTDLDKVITSLSREILNRGYSKREAYICTQQYSKQDNSLEKFRQFKQQLSAAALKNYRVILRLFVNGIANPTFADFHRELTIDHYLDESVENINRLKKFISPVSNRRFFIVDTQKYDTVSAIKEAKIRLFGELDMLHPGVSRMNVSIGTQAMVIENAPDRGVTVSLQSTQFVLDGTFPQNEAMSNKYRLLLRDIKQNQTIDESVKIRIDGALRHLRIANTDSEIEQRFINYWIALEFIFSSPLIEDNTYARLKTNLTNILSACYVERNLQYLENILRMKGMLGNEEIINNQNIDQLINDQPSMLMKFRLQNFKSNLFTESERRKKYLKHHRDNLEAHLSRIYHLRNELIHEAGINQNIEDLTSNLMYYLIFLLNQMIGYFASIPYGNEPLRKITIDEFFYEYQLIMDNIASDCTLERMRKVPYQKDLFI